MLIAPSPRALLVACAMGILLCETATAQGSAPYCYSGNGAIACKMDPWIRRTQFVTIDHPSNCFPPYENLTAISTAVVVGIPNTIDVQLNNIPDPGFVRVYVDWNQDFDFFDMGEEFVLSEVGAHGIGPITAPMNAALGPTRLRVSSGDYFGNPPTPCSSMISRDFTLFVCTDNDADGVLDCFDNCALPNPNQADCDSNGLGDVCEIAGGFQPDCDGNGIPDNCDPDCNSTGITDACDIAANTSFDLNGNGIPDECEATNGVQFCFGDGTGTACPCGNVSLPGEGCVNSTGRGALLYNAGGTSVFLDNAAPLTIQMRANRPSMCVAGLTQNNFGAGTVNFDGLLCVTVQKRFPVIMTSATGTSVLLQPGFNSGGLITPGSTWYFQNWFRDQPTSPCGTKANLSNGLGITFTP